ncbi:SDR family oxidoreductase [Corynebacterium sp. ES2715-CONJ3]|uniref:SDR family oxidoreductase n=1 Tax=Corynebacterium sp. ES2715-CONJ3 TaxID=2974028 RepID=UPI0021696FFF|nr:SDR family oxidoreductase [Corynebacterium sp. ES2715-CONJ3]MCS4492176.1 SDR family oxidoreductase [Corynebacterium sp. ES2715-CONJ3]
MTSPTRTAVITGASSGIGEASARALAADGWHVILIARRKDRLERIAQDIRGQAIVADITDDEAVRQAASLIPACDLLVNNAGGAIGLDPINHANLDEWLSMYELNVLGTVRMTQALIEKLTLSHGHIITMSSTAALYPYAGGAGYNAAKFAVSAVNKVMRIEYATDDIRVTEINPGRVHTDFSLHRFRGDSAQAEAVYANHLNLEAADIAEAVRWVASTPKHVNIDRLVITPRDQIL